MFSSWLCFSFVPLFFFLWFNDNLLCLCPLLFVFLWMYLFILVILFFNSFLYLLALSWESHRFKHILKKSIFSYSPFPHFVFDVLFYIFMFILLRFIVFIIAFTNRIFPPFWTVCWFAYLFTYLLLILLNLHMWQIEFPSLGVKLELQL